MVTTRSARRVPVARRLEDVALELFATQGFDETTVDELAVAGGVGRRTFFRYFPTKLDVVLGELDEGRAGLVRALAAEPGDDPVAAARAAFLAVNHYADAELPDGAELPPLGSVVRVVPNHVCNAVNLVDELVVYDHGSDAQPVATWRVAARGRNS